MAEQQDFLNPELDSRLQHKTDKIAGLHHCRRRQSIALHGEILADLAGNHHDRLEAECLGDTDLGFQRIFERFFRHRFDNASRSNDRQAADNAQRRIERTAGQFLAFRDRYRDDSAGSLRQQRSQRRLDHLSGRRIDCRLTDRNLQPRQRNGADAGPGLKTDFRLPWRQLDFGDDFHPVRDIRVITGILDHAGPPAAIGRLRGQHRHT